MNRKKVQPRLQSEGKVRNDVIILRTRCSKGDLIRCRLIAVSNHKLCVVVKTTLKTSAELRRNLRLAKRNVR